MVVVRSQPAAVPAAWLPVGELPVLAAGPGETVQPVPQFPYHVQVVIGDDPVTRLAPRQIRLEVAELTADGVGQAVAAADVSSADMRSSVVVSFAGDRVSVESVVVTYAYLLGFARRRLDVHIADRVCVASRVGQWVHGLACAVRPPVVQPLVTVGNAAEFGEITAVHVDAVADENQAVVDADAATVVAWARRLLWAADRDVAVALVQLCVLAALRARGASERLPALLGADGRVVDLAAVRRSGELSRSASRSDTRFALAPVPSLSARQQRLCAAAAVDIEQVLAALGARSAVVADPASGEQMRVWHCLHPQNHTNGDATPSARVGAIASGGVGFRCLRCLSERLDPLRLVMWSEGVTVDVAADLIHQWNLASAS